MFIEVAVQKIISETEKAYLLLFDTDSEPVWVPKSLTYGGINYGDELISIRDWFIAKYNIKTS